MNAPEVWLPVRGYEGLYEVSDLGRVRNIAARKGTVPGLILRHRETRDGYLKVVLRDCGRDRAMTVHRIVYEAHCRPLGADEEVDHVDGNKKNNCRLNLDAVNRLENMQRSFRRGRAMARGEAQGRARFTAEQVVAIRRRVSQGELQKALAAEFGVTPTAINCIVLRKTWAHLP